MTLEHHGFEHGLTYTWNFFNWPMQFKSVLFKGQLHGWESMYANYSSVDFQLHRRLVLLTHTLFKGQLYNVLNKMVQLISQWRKKFIFNLKYSINV